VRRGAAWTEERHQAAAWSLPWLPSRWQCCHRRADLGCKPQRRPHRRGLGVSRRAAFVVVAIEDVRMPLVPFVRSPVRIASGPAGVPAGGDGVRPDTTGHACPEPVRSWRPSWTPDTTARTSDGDQAGGRSGAAGVGRRRACALPSCPVMARMSRPHGWPWPAGQTHGRTLDAEGVRRLTAAVRTGSRPIGWAVTLNWGVRPTGRSSDPPCPSAGQPLPGVRRRN
jgi:hypothetical protein